MGVYNLASDKIGIKRLTNADLGVSTSHQTHIGLFEGTLSHLPYKRKSYTSQLIYNNKSYEGILFLKFINNNRSPAINMGSRLEQKNLPENIISVGKKIREITQTNRNIYWFLIWFALDNEEIISILLNQNSIEFTQLKKLGIDLNEISKRGLKVEKTNQLYHSLAFFLNNLTNNVNIEYLQELEIVAQTKEESIISRKIKPRRIDIERANQFFKQTGKTGEELVFKYLEEQKRLNQICDFNWVNQSRESGYPYDFEITHLNNERFFTDVKSTVYKFQQKMIFSSSELLFINQNENYQVHRVFGLQEEPKLRICNNINQVTPLFLPHYASFRNQIEQNGLNLSGLKVSIPPTLDNLHFDASIELNHLVND